MHYPLQWCYYFLNIELCLQRNEMGSPDMIFHTLYSTEEQILAMSSNMITD